MCRICSVIFVVYFCVRYVGGVRTQTAVYPMTGLFSHPQRRPFRRRGISLSQVWSYTCDQNSPSADAVEARGPETLLGSLSFLNLIILDHVVIRDRSGTVRGGWEVGWAEMNLEGTRSVGRDVEGKWGRLGMGRRRARDHAVQPVMTCSGPEVMQHIASTFKAHSSDVSRQT